MQVSVETSGDLGRILKIEVPEDRVASEVESRLKELSKTTKTQGFRPGKAPFKVIRQRYGAQVRQEIVVEVIQSSLYEALTQEKLRPVGRPEIDSLHSEQGTGIVYTAKFEVLPEITLADVGGISITKTTCVVTDEDIEKTVELLRNQNKTSLDVDRAATEEDRVNIDFTGSVDGEPFEGGELKDFEVELNTNRLIEGFEAGLIGVKAGDDLDLDLQFPEQYGDAELAGKPVKFKIKVNKVMEPVLPELDEEFFKQFGIEEGGLDALHQQLREHMEREIDSVLRSKNRDAIMDSIHDANEIDPPEILVEEEKQRMHDLFLDKLKIQGISVDDIDIDNADDDDLYREQARKRVALQLIIAELVKEHDLQIDPAKVRAQLEKRAQNYEDPAAFINWYYAEEGRLDEVEAVVLENEVTDWILDHARVTEVSIPFDDLKNKGQTETVA